MEAYAIKKWSNKDLWTLDEFVLLACDHNPDSIDDILSEVRVDGFNFYVRSVKKAGKTKEAIVKDYDESPVRDFLYCYNELLNLAKGSIILGKLVLKDYSKRYTRAAEPKVFIEWAGTKSVQLPAWMEAHENPKVIQRKQQTQEIYFDWCEQRSQLIDSGVKKYFKPDGSPNESAIAVKIAGDTKLSVDHIRKMLKRHCK